MGAYHFSLPSSCGCDAHFILPYLRCNPVDGLFETTVDPPVKKPPTWMEVKISRPLRLRSLVVYLVCTQVLAFALSNWLSAEYAQASSSVIKFGLKALGEVLTSFTAISLLASRSLGVQCTCRYLSGRCKYLPLITPEQIRGIHLIDRITNISVRTVLALELYNHVPVSPPEKKQFSNSVLNSAFSLRPIFQLDTHPDAPVCCLSLDCLVTVYRLTFAVLFDRNYQVFRSSAHTSSLNSKFSSL
ncbi:unnamed protein product [Schistocephalus solidus]|uniref:Pecanex-like protein n=1 Tax=Schistocephalus solidus TaxID=70667 RepID=A0A183TFM7_SCHSO|nr:unnamed protein product [Schistocephalus solidus]